ncbi:hypothetical protein AJ80_04996 [Polytolypa hystricis UAMH7299]|uniref:Siderophore biosynthesis n=1 Tax=Polytolypa hystricis (strain UAMH7299) TaxID=1447883 RepID=A0A2B7Y7M7_POLH7|nr:hypothetical protein AJ80_04996 [Polytolypa hystricis UAMH7299]
MSRKFLQTILALAATSSLTEAKSGTSGCTSTLTVDQWDRPMKLYYVADTGEICDIPDCGGGRAEPNRHNPLCAYYTGTSTYSPSFIKLVTETPEPTTTAADDDETAAETTADETAAETSVAFTSAPADATATGETASVTEAPTETSPPLETSGDDAPSESDTSDTTEAPATQTDNGVAGRPVAGGIAAGVIAIMGLVAM